MYKTWLIKRSKANIQKILLIHKISWTLDQLKNCSDANFSKKLYQQPFAQSIFLKGNLDLTERIWKQKQQKIILKIQNQKLKLNQQSFQSFVSGLFTNNQQLGHNKMSQQNTMVQKEDIKQQILPINRLLDNKYTKKDFESVKKHRITKLQQLLNKNVKLRNLDSTSYLNQNFCFLEGDHPAPKRSLPCIKNKGLQDNSFIQEPNAKYRSGQKNGSKKSKQANQTSNVNFDNQILKKAIKLKVQTRIQQQNPEKEQKEGNRGFLKLRVKVLQLQQQINKNQKASLKASNLQFSKSKSPLQQLKSAERISENKKQLSAQKDEKRNFRRKKRNLSQLNLTNIQHLPQIVFSKNKKCSPSKFPTTSMAQIGNNLLTHEIFELQGKMLVQAKNRQTKQRLFQQKIKVHLQSQLLGSIYH